MKLPKIIRFFISYVIVGVAVAVGVVIVYPRVMGSYLPTPTPPTSVSSGSQTYSGNTATGPVSYADAVNRTAPAIVNIHAAKYVRERNPMLDDPIMQWFFGGVPNNQTRQRIERSLGSGVIVSEDGYIITNNHVISGASTINVFLHDGRETQAQIIGVDAATDLAVLKIELENLAVVKLSNREMPHVGDVVLAIGNPFGVGQTVTQGIVSATGRSQLGINTFENYIQTDAAINPGNSGGALINAYGDLIGINTAIFTQTGSSVGIGFAIPVDLANQVMDHIVKHGLVIRGWIGVELQDISPDLAESFGLNKPQGVLIAGILTNGPADNAGLEPGDIITSIDGKSINGSREALYLISQTAPGKKVAIEGIRLGKPFNAEAEIIQRPQNVMR